MTNFKIKKVIGELLLSKNVSSAFYTFLGTKGNNSSEPFKNCHFSP